MLALWLSSAVTLSGPGSVELGPPPPTIEPQAPIEGPARPPVVEPEPPSEPEQPVEPGIEFAVDPPEDELESESVEPAALADQAAWPDPGTAPSGGMGMLVPGVIFVPSAALFTLALLRGTRGTEHTTPILVTGIGMEVIALGLIGTGSYRQVKLRRWAAAYRVVARPQGSGMLSAGGIALSFGASLIASGIVLMSSDASRKGTGAALVGVGVAGLAAAPPLIYFGKRRRDRYLASGGWYRRPLPTVELMPRVLVGRDSLGLGVAGRF